MRKAAYRLALILILAPWVVIIVGVYAVLHYFGGGK